MLDSWADCGTASFRKTGPVIHLFVPLFVHASFSAMAVLKHLPCSKHMRGHTLMPVLKWCINWVLNEIPPRRLWQRVDGHRSDAGTDYSSTVTVLVGAISLSRSRIVISLWAHGVRNDSIADNGRAGSPPIISFRKYHLPHDVTSGSLGPRSKGTNQTILPTSPSTRLFRMPIFPE